MFTTGTDTEFFLKDTEGNYVSAIRYIKGTKYEPVALPSGGNISFDNVAMEFATPVAINEDEFVDVINSSLKESLTHLPKGVVLDYQQSADFPETELQDEDARVFGCDPDFDAWEITDNVVPDGAEELPFRSVGGHLHIGYVEGSGNEFLLDDMGKVFTVRTMDVILGIGMTMLDNSQATIDRRKLYGKAGCHRPTDYGVEYRTLSNYWVFSPLLVRLVYKMASEVLRIIREGKATNLIDSIGEKEIQRVINESDTQAATHLWKNVISAELQQEVVALLEECKNKKNINVYNEWSL